MNIDKKTIGDGDGEDKMEESDLFIADKLDQVPDTQMIKQPKPISENQNNEFLEKLVNNVNQINLNPKV